MPSPDHFPGWIGISGEHGPLRRLGSFISFLLHNHIDDLCDWGMYRTHAFQGILISSTRAKNFLNVSAVIIPTNQTRSVRWTSMKHRWQREHFENGKTRKIRECNRASGKARWQEQRVISRCRKGKITSPNATHVQWWVRSMVSD